MTITLAPRLLLGGLAQLLLPDFRDLAHLHTPRRIVPLLQVPLMVVLQLHTFRHQLPVRITLLRREPWTVRPLDHMVTTRRLVAP